MYFRHHSRTASADSRDGQVSLRPCLEIEDQTKERLDCYDAQIKPAPKKTSAPAKTVNECRFIQEQDERLTCFNKFVTASSKKNTAPKKPQDSQITTLKTSHLPRELQLVLLDF